MTVIGAVPDSTNSHRVIEWRRALVLAIGDRLNVRAG
jgi:hypothetical protein